MLNQKLGWSCCRVFSMVLLSLAVLTPALARAQEPFHTLQGLQADIRKGETIRVEGTDGKKVQGTVVDISDSSLKLKIKGVSREFREPQIREVRKQYNDSIANGMRNGVIIGAIAGAVLGAAISDAFCDGCGNNQAGGAAIIGLFGAGIGAATGVVGDAMTKGYLTVFTGPKTAGNRFGVSPLLSKETKGMKLAFRF